MSKNFKDTFEITKEGLYKCKGCRTTFKNKIECYRHLEEIKTQK
jgi:hypothetical protein